MKVPAALAPLLTTLLALAATAAAQAPVVVRPELPLATVGDTTGWETHGDRFTFELPEASRVRLTLFSPSIAVGEQSGDERYSAHPLEATFTLSALDGSAAVLARAAYGVGASAWEVLFEGRLPAGRYLLRSDLHGDGKNAYIPFLLTDHAGVVLQAEDPTIDASRSGWQPAVTFERPAGVPCELRHYDGDGFGELRARLVTPDGRLLALRVSDDEVWQERPLPAAPGPYTVELLMPPERFQRTNAVRFEVICDGVPLPLPIVRADLLPDLGPVPLPTPRVELAPRAPAAPAVAVRVAAPVSVPRPRVEVAVAPRPAPRLALERRLETGALLPCEATEVVLVVRNEGAAADDYLLRELVPAGLSVLGRDDGSAAERELAWRGRLEPGGRAEHRYRLALAPRGAAVHRLAATLEGAGAALRDDAELRRVALRPVLARVAPADAVYAGDEVTLRLRVENPLPRPLALRLQTAQAGLAPAGLPAGLELPAAGTAEVDLTLTAREEASAVLQAALGLCADGGPGGGVAVYREPIRPLPELPAAELRTVVTVDAAAYDLPRLDGLAVVVTLPEGARYAPGTTRVDGRRAPDPRVAGDALVFDLPGASLGRLSFEVAHAAAYRPADSRRALIALTPQPRVVAGDEGLLEPYLGARETTPDPLPRERVGAVVLEPRDGAVVRRARVPVEVDAPLDDAVLLRVGGEEVPAERIGTRTLDRELGRQTLAFVGVALEPGPNRLELVSVAPDGRTLRDVVVVHRAGAPARVEVTPIDPLRAGATEPYRFELRVFDRWGAPAADGLLTLEIDGAVPADLDADPSALGLQVPVRDGRAELRLAPLPRPSVIAVRALLAGAFARSEFTVRSDLRDPVVSGFGSVGVGFGPGAAPRFGVEGRLFGRGRVLGRALLTVAARVPLEPLGVEALRGTDLGALGSRDPVAREAESRDGVYVRLERDLSYLQYGDFLTGFEGSLLALGRAYTGLAGAYRPEGGPVGAVGYVAWEPRYDRVTDLELPSDGTSVVRLPDAPVVDGSVVLEIVKTDRLDPTLPLDDGDPRVGPQRPLFDYTVDEAAGVLTLARPLPTADARGNPYLLRIGYRLPDGTRTGRALQAGAQLRVDLGDGVRGRLGAYREDLGADGLTQVLATGASLVAGPAHGDVEIAYGRDPADGGLAATLRVAARDERRFGEASYRWLAPGFRSAAVRDGAQAGHGVRLAGGAALGDGFGVSAEATLQTGGGGVDVGGQLLGTWAGAAELELDGVPIGRDPDVQLGVQHRGGAWRAVAGAGLSEPFGLEGAGLELLHRQGLGRDVRSVSSFGVSVRLLDHLAVRLTDELTWGVGHRLLAGLEATLEHDRALALLCGASGPCRDPRPEQPLGETRLLAQYEIPGGAAAGGGRVRLALDTRLPLTERLRLEPSAERIVDLDDPARNATVLALGARWDDRDLDAEASAETRLAAAVKVALRAHATFALADDLYGDVRAAWLRDPSGAPAEGFRLEGAVAYRGDTLTVLADHALEGGLYADGATRLRGDTRLDVRVDPEWSVRAGHLYELEPGTGLLDLWSLGAAARSWPGGEIGVYLRLANDWGVGAHSPGLGLEVGQALGCGATGVAGVNLFDGVGFGGEMAGAIYTGPGVYLRLDLAFDEAWSCDAAELRGVAFHDRDADGERDDGEEGVAGLRLELLDEAGAVVAETITGGAGGYRFGRLEPGAYRLRAAAQGPYLGAELALGPLEGGERREGLELALEARP